MLLTLGMSNHPSIRMSTAARSLTLRDDPFSHPGFSSLQGRMVGERREARNTHGVEVTRHRCDVRLDNLDGIISDDPEK
jgi:hypothetical protein